MLIPSEQCAEPTNRSRPHRESPVTAKASAVPFGAEQEWYRRGYKAFVSFLRDKGFFVME